jgi:hypothetical protein
MRSGADVEGVGGTVAAVVMVVVVAMLMYNRKSCSHSS